MMTLFDWQARNIEMQGVMLAHVLSTTREDRLDWKPSADPESKSRSALDLAAECIGVNRYFTALLRGEEPSTSMERPFTTGQEAQQLVRDSAADLASVVRGLDEAAIAHLYATSRGPLPGALLIGFASLHLAYHVGQVNYIQTLYGDPEFRIPPEFMER